MTKIKLSDNKIALEEDRSTDKPQIDGWMDLRLFIWPQFK